MKLYNLLYSIWIIFAFSLNIIAVFTYPHTPLSYVNIAIVILACIIYPPFQYSKD
jgi:hypothetical protein